MFMGVEEEEIIATCIRRTRPSNVQAACIPCHQGLLDLGDRRA